MSGDEPSRRAAAMVAVGFVLAALGVLLAVIGMLAAWDAYRSPDGTVGDTLGALVFTGVGVLLAFVGGRLGGPR